MPTAGDEMPIQRVPSGLPGPGGIGFAPLAHEELGGIHHGLRCIWMMRNRPFGVGNDDWPVATPKRRQRVVLPLAKRYRCSRLPAREMVMAGGSLARESLARTFVSFAVISRAPGGAARRPA